MVGDQYSYAFQILTSSPVVLPCRQIVNKHQWLPNATCQTRQVQVLISTNAGTGLVLIRALNYLTRPRFRPMIVEWSTNQGIYMPGKNGVDPGGTIWRCDFS